MKFAVVGDVHVADQAPSTRKDDYKNVVLKKLQFIVDHVVHDGGYTGVIFTGDLFHKKIPFHNSHSLISELIEMFKMVECPMFIVPGNHDIHGNMATFENQPLNVLVRAGVITLLTGNAFYFKADGMVCSLNGVPFSPLMDSKNAANLYNLNHLEDADCKISVFHQMILPDDKRFFNDYINFSDLANINADCVICGHYHEGFNPSMRHEHDKYFLNPGSITRGTAEQANFDKVPKFVTLNVLPGANFSVEEHVIPHIAAEDIFDFNVIERNRKKKDMHEFMDGLSEMEAQSLSTQEPSGVINALRILGMDQRLEKLALQYLDEAYAVLA